MDREAVLEIVEPHMGIKAKVLDADFKVLWSADEGLAIRPGRGKQSLAIAEAGVERLQRLAHIPDALAKTLDAQTVATVLDQSLHAGTAPSLLVRDKEIVDVAPAGTFHPVNPERLLASLEKGVGETDYTRVLDLPNHTLQVECAGMEEHQVVRGKTQVNDLLRGGVVMRFSPVGLTNTEVQAYMLRLVCTNGMTVEDVLVEYKYTGDDGDGEGNGGSLYPWVQTSARQSYKAIGPVISRYEQLAATEIPADDRAFLLARLIKDAKLTGKEVDAVQAEALRAPPETEWDMLNLLTWATSHVMEDGGRIRRAQIAASGYATAESHSRLCPTCSRN